MTESPIVNEWIAQAGEEAERRGARNVLIRVLQARFPGQVPGTAVEAITAQTNLAVLGDWVERAAVLPLGDFLAGLPR